MHIGVLSATAPIVLRNHLRKGVTCVYPANSA